MHSPNGAGGNDFQMMNNKWERGAGKLGTIIGLVLLIIVIVMAVEWIPKRVNVYQLRDEAEQKARYLGTGQIFGKDKVEKVRIDLLKEARSLELPVKEENIKIYDDSRAWWIELTYNVELDFIVFKKDWKIDQKVEGVKISM